jgi:carboxyl-terminal processing protease
MHRLINFQKLGMISGPFFLLIIAIGFGWASADETYSFVKLFDLIALTVSEKYIEPIDIEKMVKAGVNGMVGKLDPYSQYLSGPDFEYLMQETQGEYCGIGVTLENRHDTLCVTSTYDDSPARLAGLHVGDRLLRVDTTNVLGKTKTQCLNLLRGEPESKVVLRIKRPPVDKEMRLDLKRAELTIDPVPYYGVDDEQIGYIKISRFTEGSAQEIELVVRELMVKNVNGFILDLRGNPGGLLFESVEAAALFLKKGDKIVETRGRGSYGTHTYKANVDGIYMDGPLTVLVDDQTASAAEILAGAIQDHDRGIIIGTTSYGKGLVQQIFQFDSGSALKLTTAKYYTPSDRCIQKDTLPNELTAAGAKSDKTAIYATDSNRPMFGGGGIIPDIYMEKTPLAPILKQIINLGYLMEFIDEYSSNTTIEDDFEVTDELIEEFEKFLQRNKFSYANSTESAYRQFIASNNLNQNDRKLSGHIEALGEILAQRSIAELQSVRGQLKDLLYENFLNQCLGTKKSIELGWLKNSPEIIKAKEIMANRQSYANLLTNL